MAKTDGESPTINAVVVGVGRMGQHHARNYAAIPGYKLVAVVDVNAENAQKMSGAVSVPVKRSPRWRSCCSGARRARRRFRRRPFALPTIHHRAAAEKLAAAGADLLIEKPLASNVADGKAIVDAAAKYGRVLQVGHSERFNPAYRALKKYQLTPAFIEVHRISPMTFRSIDVGVVLDMMIHDIDIVNHLVKRPVVEVRAVGVAVIGKYEDLANARLTFDNGCVANLTASRLALRARSGKCGSFRPTPMCRSIIRKNRGGDREDSQ